MILFTLIIAALNAVQLRADDGCLSNITATVTFDYYNTETTVDIYMHINNIMVDSLLLIDGSGYYPYGTATKTVCEDDFNFADAWNLTGVNNDDICWTVKISDSHGDGLMDFYGYGWFSVQFNDQTITAPYQTFTGYSSEIYFCNSLLDTSDDLTQEYQLSLTTDTNGYGFDYIIKSISTTTSNGSNFNSSSLVYENKVAYIASTATTESLFNIADGCYEVTLANVLSFYSYTLTINGHILATNLSTEIYFCTYGNFTSAPTGYPTACVDLQVSVDFALLGGKDDVWVQVVDNDNDETLLYVQESTLGYYPDTHTFDMCLETGNCATMSVFDAYEDIHWVQLMVDDNYVTFGQQQSDLRIFDLYFCPQIFELDSSSSNNNNNSSSNGNQHNLTIYLDYDAVIVISNTSDFSQVSDMYDIDLLYRNPVYFVDDDVDTRNDQTFSLDEGCFEITFTSINVNSQTDYRGECIVYLNGNIVGYCGVYDATDSSIVVCTSTTHISRCIVPNYCSELSSTPATAIYESEYERYKAELPGIKVYSYKGLANAHFGAAENYLCLGTSSCYKTFFHASVRATVYCQAPHSCSEHSAGWIIGNVVCNAPESCGSLITDTTILNLYLYVFICLFLLKTLCTLFVCFCLSVFCFLPCACFLYGL